MVTNYIVRDLFRSLQDDFNACIADVKLVMDTRYRNIHDVSICITKKEYEDYVNSGGEPIE